MEEIKSCLLIVVFFGLATFAQAQDRYAVYYKFKPQQNLSLDNPGEFLTEKAISRRVREGIAPDSLDLPVSPNYLEAVAEKAEYVLYSSKWMNATLLVADEESVEELEALPFVERVELVGVGFLQNPGARIMGDFPDLPSKKYPKPLSKASRSLGVQENPYDFQNELLGIPLMHEEGFTGKGVTIAVFDAGFPGVNTASSLAHLQSNNQIIATRDFVRPWNDNVYTDNQHGTNVISLIASNEPEILVAGAPDATYILAMTEEVATEYRIEEFNWVRAAEYADSLGADIINSSVGYWDFDDPAMNYSLEDLDGKTATITKGATIAASKGILVVNSVGNYGSGESTLVAPADAKGIFAVGAVNSDLEVASFSSRGPTADGRIKPDLSAFGVSAALVRSNGSLGFANGTSFSAPQISALAAGLWEARPDWTKDKLIENLLNSGTQADDPDNLLGFGIPNYRDALYGEILSIEQNEVPLAWKIYPNPLTSNEISIEFGTSLQSEFTLIDMGGRKVVELTLNRPSAQEPFLINLQNLKSGLYIIQMQDQRLIRRIKVFKQ